ncbi:hypothetical protein CR513_56652, partial [Mucuna pruriens]
MADVECATRLSGSAWRRPGPPTMYDLCPINDLEGFPSIKDRLHQLRKEGDWQTFMDVYGLLIYSIVLFPQIEDYIDLAVVDAFLAKKDRGENTVIVVLANTYYTLNYCYEKNRKGLRCCTPLLYLWMAAHLFHSKRRMTYPIEDHYWSWIKPMTLNMSDPTDSFKPKEGSRPRGPGRDPLGKTTDLAMTKRKNIAYMMVVNSVGPVRTYTNQPITRTRPKRTSDHTSVG